MKNPFPGMNPYLEQHWRDVHSSLIIYARDQLQEQLPGDLRARVEERVLVESPQNGARSIYPDVRVIEHGRPGPAPPPSGATGVAIAEPLIIHLPDEPMTETFVEIIEVGSGRRVVTVIEILSPSNKLPGEGQDLYLRKQRELKEGGVSLVEIDLLRAGRRVMMVPPEQIPPSHRTTYQVLVRRGSKPKDLEAYRAPLRERLPIVPIPLRDTDVDVTLDLQELVDRCYRHGRYDDIDYQCDPDPPLEAADAAWLDQLLRNQGLRT